MVEGANNEMTTQFDADVCDSKQLTSNRNRYGRKQKQRSDNAIRCSDFCYPKYWILRAVENKPHPP